MQAFELTSIPSIMLVCYSLIELIKRTLKHNETVKNIYPLISAFLGSLLGMLMFLSAPDLILSDTAFGSALIGMASGLSATGGHQILKHLKKEKISCSTEEENAPPRYFITGDKHRRFDRLIKFCQENHLRKKDVIVILGDSGFNYYEDERDDKLKAKLNSLGVALFCLHGNKEKRPQNIPTYGLRSFCGGIVYYEPKYPRLFFAKDGETYTFNGKEFMVIGGAHSVDKLRCLNEDKPFWEDEMPSDEIKALVEQKLAEKGNQIYGLLTHTCPISCLPTEMFVSTHRAAKAQKRRGKRMSRREKKAEYPLDIDRSTEEWLETIKNKVDFSVWYCGHYHVDKALGKISMLHREILPFCPIDEEL